GLIQRTRPLGRRLADRTACPVVGRKELAASPTSAAYGQRFFRRARASKYASVPPTTAAPPISPIAANVVGGGGRGTAARAASLVARRRASSSFRLASPCAIAHR